jgi:hypothetical protein
VSAKLYLSALALTCAAFAQSADQPRGHWTGALELPNRSMAVAFDLDKTDKGWIGSMSIVEQGATLPIADIRAEAGQWKFTIPGGPGGPGFAGKLSADGKTWDGQFTQGGNSLPLKLTHAGAPKVDLPKESAALAAEYSGEWEGTLEGPGLRLRLSIVNSANTAKATLVSIDQGGAQIPVSAISVKDGKLTAEVKAVNGGYTATLNKEGTELSGDWSQNGNSMPLKLKKSAAKPTP